MTNKQIEKAVDEYIGYPPEMDEGIETTMRRNAFKDGANWRINSVWHKPEEVPEEYRPLLVECVEGYKIWGLWPDYAQEWEFIANNRRVVRWAYADDLIPTEDETA